MEKSYLLGSRQDMKNLHSVSSPTLRFPRSCRRRRQACISGLYAMLAQCGESPGRSVLRSKKYGTVVRQYRVLSVRYLRIRAADPAVRPIGAAATQSQPSRHFLVRIQHIVARTDLDHFARRSRRYPSPPYCAFFIFFCMGPFLFFLSLYWETGPILIRSIDFPYKSALRLGWF